MPYQRVTDAYLSVAANVMLMLVFLGGLLVKIHTDIAFATNERTAVTILGFEGVALPGRAAAPASVPEGRLPGEAEVEDERHAVVGCR